MSKTNKIILGILAVLIIIFFVVRGTSMNKKSTDGEVIKIGAALALTGDAGYLGESEKKGIDMAVEEINKNSKIKIEVIYEDIRSNSKDSISAVQKLANIDNVKYIIGPTWLDSYPGAQGVVKGKDITLITPSASATAINYPEVTENVYTTWFRTEGAVKKLIESIQEKGIKKISLVFQNDAYYLDYIKEFEKFAKESNIEIASKDLFNPGSVDFKTLFLKIKKDNTAIVFAMYDPKITDSFMKQKQQIIPEVQLFTNGEVVLDYIKNPDYIKSIENIVFTQSKTADSDFLSKFKNIYQNDPLPGASNAYDAMYIINDLLNNKKELKKSSFDTVTFGKINFDNVNGVVPEKEVYSTFEVKNGQITEIIK